MERSGEQAGTKSKANGFVYMDAMRALAAGVVVLNHVRDLTLTTISPGAGIAWKLLYFFAGFGHQAVMIFFVLSGFWITGAVVRREKRAHFWAEYLVDRLSRLEIVLLPALLLGGALDWVGTHLLTAPIYFRTTGAVSVPPNILNGLSPSAFGGNLLFLQSIAVPVFGSNSPLWSLANEFWYYLWFPALWFAVRGRWSWVLLSLVMVWFAAPIAWSFPCWLCGSALYFTLEAARKRDLIGRKRIGWPALLLLLPLFAAVTTVARMHPEYTTYLDWAVSGSFALVLLALCIAAPIYPRALSGVARFGAESSYSLYVIHFPLLMFLLALISPAQRMAPGLRSLGVVVLLYLATVAAGWAFSMATERHTKRLRDRIHRWLPVRQK